DGRNLAGLERANYGVEARQRRHAGFFPIEVKLLLGYPRFEGNVAMTMRPGVGGSQPPLNYPPYQSTARRAPREPLIRLPETLSDLESPVHGWWPIGETDNDLTRQHADEPQ